jgi:uncharacterized linocin/CFP29 family protein
MNDLLREHAPISSEAWSEIDAEATRTLKTLLAARRPVVLRSCRRRCRKVRSRVCATRCR